MFFTKLDVIAAFNCIRKTEGHEWKTAFIICFGIFKILVIPGSLCNALSTFKIYSNHTLQNALDRYCTAYLDEVLIYSNTRKDYMKHVSDVICQLGDAGLQIDITKSDFYTQETKYLGLLISTKGM